MKRGPRNFAVAFAATFGAMVVNIVASGIFVRRLTATEFGAWVILSSFFTYSGLLDLGIGQALVRLLASERGRPGGDPLVYLGTAIRAYGLLGVLAFVAVLAGGVGYLGSRGLDVRPGSDLFAVDLVLACAALITLPAGVLTGVLGAHERYDLINGIGVAAVLVPTLGSIAFFLAGHGSVLILALAAAGVVVLSAAARFLFALRVEPELLRGLRHRGSPGELRRLVGFSLGFFVQTIAVMAIWRLDPLLVGAAVSVAAVTTYALAQRIAAAFSDLGTIATGTLMPSFARTHAGGQAAELSRGVVVLTRAAVLLVVPATLLLMLESRALLLVWVGTPYDRGAPIAAALLAAVGVTLLRGPSLVALQAFYPLGRLALLSVLEAMSKLVLSVLLVLSLRELGIALATLIPAAGFTVFAYLRICLRQLGLSPGELFGGVSLRAVIATAVSALWFLIPLPGGYLAVAGVHGLLLVLTYLLLITVTTPGPERAAARTLAASAWRTALAQ